MQYVFQCFTGDLSEVSLEDAGIILSKLKPFHEAGQLKAVMAGWSLDLDFYRSLKETLDQWGVPLYLKLAVFSEWNGYEGFEKTVPADGREVSTHVLSNEETFEFRCPTSEHNLEEVLSLYDRHFAEIGFSGVFLDRIRYSSLTSGLAGMGCFCDRCQKIYRRKGLDPDKVREKLLHYASGQEPELQQPLRLLEYTNDGWRVNDPELDAFFRVRCEIIEESLGRLIDAFHERGLKVGLDLFAPSLGYFAGQRFRYLGEKADFVKPMLYRYTDAPAGIPFEVNALRDALGESAAEDCLSVFGTEAEHYRKLAEQELTNLRSCSCDVYPGFEVNTVPGVVTMSPERVRDMLNLIRNSGFDTVVPSWNLAMMPKENLIELH